MLWLEIRKAYPNRWLIVEALEAHTTTSNRRVLNHLAVVESCSDSKAAMQRYRLLHQQYPQREFYFVHTSRAELDIRERHWAGIRRTHAAAIDLRRLESKFVD